MIKKSLIDKIEYHQQININNKINNNLKSNILKIKNNSKNNENDGSKNNKIIRSKIKLLKKISVHLIDPYATVCDFDKETFFDNKTDIEIKSHYEYKEFIIDLRNLLLKLKDKDEIYIILHIIDTKSNLYITQKYKKINSKLKEKDKWIYYDKFGWGILEPRRKFNKEKFIEKFTYAYEDK